MPWTEHLGGNKYKLVARDPSKVNRPKKSTVVVIPAEIVRSHTKAERWLTLELAKWTDTVESGLLPGKGKDSKLTFRDFVPKWKKGYADQNMGGYTVKNTMAIVETRLMDAFGDTRLDKITTLHLVTYFAELTNQKNGEPLATNTKLNIYKAAKSIFDAAADWGVISFNPIDGVKRPGQSKRERKQIRSRKKHYSWAEVEQLLIALYKLPVNWRLYFTGCMLGGFRRGELLAVEWKDVSHDRRAIWIDKQITLDEDGNTIVGEVKTESSEGWVGMPAWYMEELKRLERIWRKEKLQCKKWKGADKQYLFHGGNGLPYYPTTPTLTWRRFLQKHELQHVKLHGLRHTAGMLLRESGSDLKTIQERLRHAKLDMSAEYTHESDIINREVVDKLESLNPKNIKIAPSIAP
ncbi:tyrosine-type recombinase/integrase [Paenibacillus monticola]|uniref:Tyrosine-type recombinase/integrase n=1 Tax=Paenibacillus monticola TaxID=2666075 RepID=A0A7X2L0B6_9BACL|nr:site-specific integrase [Paenibacillus monticola]MRN51953.1 tyrosine-type recombinase/integrase [Paenibacillus monticola]